MGTARYSWMAAVAVAAWTGLAAGGCAVVVTEVAQKAWEDRNTEDQVTDTKILARFLKDLAGLDKSLVFDVSADVWERRMMLTGTLDDPRIRDKVAGLARSDKRIEALYDEIMIVTTADRDRRRQARAKDDGAKGGIGQTVDDFWIETKIKGKLLLAKGVTSVNFRWRCVRNTVYLLGRARSAGELKKVLAEIRDTEGVKAVKHFVRIEPAA